MTAICGGGKDTTTEDVLTWLRAMPAEDRERVACLLGSPATRAAIRDVRAEAVVELLDRPGSTWQTVADGMGGVSTATVNKLVSAHNARLRRHAPAAP